VATHRAREHVRGLMETLAFKNSARLRKKVDAIRSFSTASKKDAQLGKARNIWRERAFRPLPSRAI